VEGPSAKPAELPLAPIAFGSLARYDPSVNLRSTIAIFIMSFIAGGCASSLRVPQQPGGPHERPGVVQPAEPEPSPGEKIVDIAEGMIGTPYRYGGETPQGGFDCSGLVFYSFERAGLKVPRTAAEQRKAAERVKREQLELGDLVFFRSSKGRIDHVGIYAGDGRFIHAPNTGKVVSYAYLDDPYYQKHFVSAGRF
jgi:cell wall-associated NlpC family hydrolase